MTNEIDFPTTDEIVARCRDFVSKGGRVIAGSFSYGPECGCPMTIMGICHSEASATPEQWAFIEGFDLGGENPYRPHPLRALGAEVRRRLEAEGLMADQ